MKHHLALLSRRFALTQLAAADDFWPQAWAFSEIDKLFPAGMIAAAANGLCRTALMILLLASTLQGTAVPAEEQTGWLSGVETWGGRPALPALVNPVVTWPLQSVLRLRGEWEFVTRETAPLRHPGWNAFYARPWLEARAIQVPGCWEAQGVGTSGMGDSWDCKWDHCAKPLRWVYKGDAWYRKTVTIPEAWRGQRIWLKVGGVPSSGWFWVNQRPVAWVDNYCGTYKYDITDRGAACYARAGRPSGAADGRIMAHFTECNVISVIVDGSR